MLNKKKEMPKIFNRWVRAKRPGNLACQGRNREKINLCRDISKQLLGYLSGPFIHQSNSSLISQEALIL